MNFQPVEFSSDSAVRYSFSLRAPEARYEPYSRIVAVHFDGVYRLGSGGKPDARLIVGITQAAATIWKADALILDLRGLDYQWGDDMEWVLSPLDSDRDVPFAIVGSDLCLPAISTLIFGVNTQRSALEKENIFDDFEKAAAWVEAKLAWKGDELRRDFGPAGNQNA